MQQSLMLLVKISVVLHCQPVCLHLGASESNLSVSHQLIIFIKLSLKKHNYTGNKKYIYTCIILCHFNIYVTRYIFLDIMHTNSDHYVLKVLDLRTTTSCWNCLWRFIDDNYDLCATHVFFLVIYCTCTYLSTVLTETFYLVWWYIFVTRGSDLDFEVK